MAINVSTKKNDTGKGNTFKLIDLGERYLCYMAEQALLISISSMIVYALGIKPVLLGFFLLYKINFVLAFTQLFTTNAGLQNLFIWFTFSFIYYSFEVLTNLGIFRGIFKGKIISKYDVSNNKLTRLLLLRSLVKSFFISNLINSLFIFRFRNLNSRIFTTINY